MLHRKVLEQRDSVYEKISQYLQLKSVIQSLQVPFLFQCCWSLETKMRPQLSLEEEHSFISPTEGLLVLNEADTTGGHPSLIHGCLLKGLCDGTFTLVCL